MPLSEDTDIPTLRELFRTMTDWREEWRADKAQMVRKDVHGVEHDGLVARIVRLEADVKKLESAREQQEKDRTTIRNQYYFSVVGAVLSMIVAVVVAAVK